MRVSFEKDQIEISLRIIKSELKKASWVKSVKVDYYIDSGEANCDMPTRFLIVKTRKGKKFEIYLNYYNCRIFCGIVIVGVDKSTIKLLESIFSKYGYMINKR